jgi:hypothetical protein
MVFRVKFGDILVVGEWERLWEQAEGCGWRKEGRTGKKILLIATTNTVQVLVVCKKLCTAWRSQILGGGVGQTTVKDQPKPWGR